jgi:hypothetical protein
MTTTTTTTTPTKQKVVTIDTIDMLQHKHGDFEMHLKNDAFFMSPLNWAQIILWWILGFRYVSGMKYTKLMGDG